MSNITSPKLILYIAMSLDGFIAKQDGGLSFLSMVEKDGEDYGYADFMKSIETIIVGRKTYEKVLLMGFDYAAIGKKIFVITRTECSSQRNVNFYTGDIKLLVDNLKCSTNGNIYCDGGAQIVNAFLQMQLFDELIISIIPVLLGNGIRLFNQIQTEQKLTLLGSENFEKGLVQLHYRITNEHVI